MSGEIDRGPTDAAAELRLGAIGQIAIVVHDLARATAFYRDTLRLPFLFDVPDQLSFFDAGGVRLMLSYPESGHDHPGSILYFRVTAIEAAQRVLVSRGARFLGEPHKVADLGSHELWLTFFQDTEGTTLSLMEERAKP